MIPEYYFGLLFQGFLIFSFLIFVERNICKISNSKHVTPCRPNGTLISVHSIPKLNSSSA